MKRINKFFNKYLRPMIIKQSMVAKFMYKNQTLSRKIREGIIFQYFSKGT